MQLYCFDGSFAGLLCCVFRAFQFKEFEVEITTSQAGAHLNLFAEPIDIATNEQQAERVWQGLIKKLDKNAIRQIQRAFLSESIVAHQHIFNYCVYVFQHQYRVSSNYANPDVLGVAQWAKQVGREKHRMEAFVRFKKTKQGLYVALVSPDFNVLPLIERHFKARYQDQAWLIYDEKRDYGIYYDQDKVQQVHMQVNTIDKNIENGFSQDFSLEMDEDEALYDQLWKDYFRSVNIVERCNLKLHIQYVPKRYWRYLNEKEL